LSILSAKRGFSLSQIHGTGRAATASPT